MVEKREQQQDIPDIDDEQAIGEVPFPVIVGNLYEELQTVIHGYGMDSLQTSTKAREVRKKMLDYWLPRLKKEPVKLVHLGSGIVPEYIASAKTVTDVETTTCEMTFQQNGTVITKQRLDITAAFHPEEFQIDGNSQIFTIHIDPQGFRMTHTMYQKKEDGTTKKEKDEPIEFRFG